MSDTVFITWGRASARAYDMAAAFQPPMELWEIQTRQGKPQLLGSARRYLAAARETWQRLHTAKPRAIFVQSPPIFAGIVVALYARRSSARWIVDLHSSPFNSKQWGWSLPLQRWLAESATATLVHGACIRAQTRDWNGRVLDSAEPPPTTRLEWMPERAKHFRVQVICSFSFDEPLAALLDAARQLPATEFHITGDTTRAAPALLVNPPSNVTFTGYLARADYFRELAAAHAVMTLTTRPDALQMGAWEAMYFGQPLILSDQPALRGYYACGAIFVANTAQGIADGVRRMRVEEAQRRVEIQVLAAQKRCLWEAHRAELEVLLVQT